MEAMYPEIMTVIKNDFKIVRKFYGTLNGGTVFVCLYDNPKWKIYVNLFNFIQIFIQTNPLKRVDAIMTNKPGIPKPMYIDSELETDTLDDFKYSSDNLSQPRYKPISIVIPAYNEEQSISYQIEALKKMASSHGVDYELIVVDDGSEDNTAAKASTE